MRVLYVEDDGIVAKSVQQMLESEGHDCDATASGKRAVELAKRGRYDIILLDIMLPDIDGYEVIKRLRAAGVRAPLLIQTGLVGEGYQKEGLSLGVSQYLVKPFNKKELFERIEGVVSSARHKPAEEPAVEQMVEDFPQDRTDERRRHRRFETTLPAKILHDDGIDCVILNMSYGGAAIQLPSAETVCPAVFDLQIAFGSKFRCKVCWRFQDKIGVKGEDGWTEQIMASSSRAEDTAPASYHAAPPPADEDLPLSYAPKAQAAEPQLEARPSNDREQDGPQPNNQVHAEEPTAAADRVAKPVPATVAEPVAEAAPAAQAERQAEALPAIAQAETVESAPAAQGQWMAGSLPAVAAEWGSEPEPAAMEEPAAEPAPSAPSKEGAEPQPGEQLEETSEQEPAAVTEQTAEAVPAAVEEPAAGGATAPRQEAQSKTQRFVVDAGVRLVAERLECGELLVSGRLEASVRTERLWIAPEGLFTGDAEVGTADVAGRFEGSLNVAGRLVIDGGGCVSGSAQYGEILVRPGGEISGEFKKVPAGPEAGPADLEGPVAAVGRRPQRRLIL